MLIVGNANSVHLEHRVRIYREAYLDCPIDLATFHSNPGWAHGEVIQAWSWLPRPFAVVWLALNLLLSSKKYLICNVQSVGWYSIPALTVRSPVMATVYGSEVRGRGKAPLLRSIQKLLFKKSLIVHVVSQPMKDFVETEYKLDNVVKIHTGVHIDDIGSNQRSPSLGETRIGLIRSVAPNYRTLESLESLTPILKENHNIQVYVFLGYYSDSYLKTCMDKVNHNNISDQVHFLPFLDRKQWFISLSELDVAVSIPTQDQIGASLLEALAVGVPVILTAGAIYRELHGTRGCYFMNELKDLPILAVKAATAHRLKTETLLPSEFDATVAANKFKELVDRVFIRGEPAKAVQFTPQ